MKMGQQKRVERNGIKMKAKKRILSCLCILLPAVMLFAMLSGCGSQGQSVAAPNNGLDSDGKVWKLNATSHLNATSVKTIGMQKWADDVKEATGGRVEITIFPGGTLATSTGALDAVKSKAVDVALVYTPFTPGQFPLAEVISNPLLGLSTSQQGTSVLWDLWEQSEALRNEFSEVKLCMMYANPANVLIMGSEEVTSVADLKGKKVRAPAGAITDILTAWGAEPMLMGPGDVYQALEKGVLNGYVFDYSGINDFALQEISHYYLDMNIYSGPMTIMMNKDVWESFPDDIKEAIDSVSGREPSMSMADMFQADEDECKELCLSLDGNQLVPLSDAAMAEFSSIADDYNATWAANASKNGFDGEAYLTLTKDLIAKYTG